MLLPSETHPGLDLNWKNLIKAQLILLVTFLSSLHSPQPGFCWRFPLLEGVSPSTVSFTDCSRGICWVFTVNL